MVPFCPILNKLRREKNQSGVLINVSGNNIPFIFYQGFSSSQSTRPFLWIFLRENDNNTMMDGRIDTMDGSILFNCL